MFDFKWKVLNLKVVNRFTKETFESTLDWDRQEIRFLKFDDLSIILIGWKMYL